MNPEHKSDTIHILCATDEKFSAYIGVMLTSLLENNRQHFINIWIATTDSNTDNLRLLSSLSETYNCRVKFIHVTQEEMDALPDAKGDWSKETYLRLTALKSLPPEVTKVIYLDGDIIVNTDLGELWGHPLDDKAVAAAVDINEYIFDNRSCLQIVSPYFNAGVMVMDINKCNNLNLSDRCIEIISHNTLDYLDQDALNMVLDGHVSYVSPKWNLVAGYLITVFQDQIPAEIQRLIRDAIHNHRDTIIHYTGIYKPWKKGSYMFHPLYEVWLKYFRMSPWRHLDIFIRTPISFKKRIIITYMKILHRLGIRSRYNDTWLQFKKSTRRVTSRRQVPYKALSWQDTRL